jgi:hypothetical protein
MASTSPPSLIFAPLPTEKTGLSAVPTLLPKLTKAPTLHTSSPLSGQGFMEIDPSGNPATSCKGGNCGGLLTDSPTWLLDAATTLELSILRQLTIAAIAAWLTFYLVI